MTIELCKFYCQDKISYGAKLIKIDRYIPGKIGKSLNRMNGNSSKNMKLPAYWSLEVCQHDMQECKMII